MAQADFLRSCISRGLHLRQQGHRFARYADDLIVVVKSRRVGERVMGSLTRYLEHTLKLKVNPAKSRVALMSERSFLDFTIRGKKIRWTEKSQANFKHRVKNLLALGSGLQLQVRLRGLGQSEGKELSDDAACKAEPEVSDPARCQQQKLLVHGTNPGDTTGAEQHMVGSAGVTQRERPVVQGPGLHATQNFVAQASLRTRTVG